jgi:hypothetical protein
LRFRAHRKQRCPLHRNCDLEKNWRPNQSTRRGRKLSGVPSRVPVQFLLYVATVETTSNCTTHRSNPATVVLVFARSQVLVSPPAFLLYLSSRRDRVSIKGGNTFSRIGEELVTSSQKIIRPGNLGWLGPITRHWDIALLIKPSFGFVEERRGGTGRGFPSKCQPRCAPCCGENASALNFPAPR